MTRYICVHGHFYQPPRENPWIESIERQPSAHPYRDWNARITAECYGPNARARILNEKGRIANIVSNYARMSFNFGPTLLAWLEAESPRVYQSILSADRESAERFGGHGSAMAQVHGHLIMPLANERDKRTQVLWGVRDFEKRFGRAPEGMWLAETAADTATLEALAGAGIRFTVLAPGQAARVRKIGDADWRETPNASVGPRRPYRVALPSGKSIAVFFYDGPISQGVAFENLLEHGGRLLDRLTGAIVPDREEAQLVHIATDGETYGHHHRFGEMALAVALDDLDKIPDVTLTNYAQFLAEHPPEWEAEIFEGSSWSCAHGIERWRSDCGCRTGGDPGWNQRWRKPLRESLDWLRDRLAEDFETLSKGLFPDPWAVRDEFIEVLFDRRPEVVDDFLERAAGRPLSAAESVLALRLLEMQRHAMSMFTSCGWFFTELSGIEGVQILSYADRALNLCRDSGGRDHESGLLARLKKAECNAPEYADGRALFEGPVRSTRVDLVGVGAHFGASTLYETPPEERSFHAFRVRRKDARVQSGEKARLAVGLAAVESTITREASEISYCFFDPGDQQIVGGARVFQGKRAYEKMVWALTDRFSKGDTAAIAGPLAEHFPGATCSLSSFLREDRERIVERVLEEAKAEAESVYAKLFESRAGLYRFLEDHGVKRPPELDAAAESAIAARIRESLRAEPPDFEAAREAIEQARKAGIQHQTEEAAYRFERAMEWISGAFRGDPDRLDLLERLERGASLAGMFNGGINLWQVQNDYWFLRHRTFDAVKKRSEDGDSAASRWVELFASLADKLNFAL
jgi:alpha-amylase/alpha-mannosidase (GH57 family)